MVTFLLLSVGCVTKSSVQQPTKQPSSVEERNDRFQEMMNAHDVKPTHKRDDK